MGTMCCDLIDKLGHPGGELLTTEHWRVVVRKKQVTLGSLILASKRHALSLGALSPAEAAELPAVCRTLEATLQQVFQPDKLNYLALMMVDPHLHFHVLPRYAGSRQFAGSEFADLAWGGPPRLDVACPEPAVVTSITAALQDAARRASEGIQ